jgi:hypothetical protein
MLEIRATLKTGTTPLAIYGIKCPAFAHRKNIRKFVPRRNPCEGRRVRRGILMQI